MARDERVQVFLLPLLPSFPILSFLETFGVAGLALLLRHCLLEICKVAGSEILDDLRDVTRMPRTTTIVILQALLAVCAVVVDLAHVATEPGSRLD